MTFTNKAAKILQEDGIDLFVDGGVRVAQLLNESRFDLSNPNSAINSTKSPEKRALEKAAKLRSEEKKLERKLRVKAEQMRLQAAAEEPEVCRTLLRYVVRKPFSHFRSTFRPATYSHRAHAPRPSA